VKSGKLRLLATTGRARAREFPDSPTLFELIKDELAVQENWLGVSFMAKTPAPIVRRMHAEILKAIADPQVLRGMESSGTNVSPNASPEEFAAYVRGESEKWGKIVKLSGAKVE
jgi:tripartite-type tricarboxylate transporter receptor subunit TctC